MNESATAAKAQIIEKLRSATNILVTVSADPSVDSLSACIAATMLLNKYKKNATAVFSGQVPSLLNFLKPDENLEKNTDSLRDFIISLDKSKADKLRYKVEDDVVKIFITPYRTSLTNKDFRYSAGDFNVDLILALGVRHQQDLDKAITAHGRIFHDAVTMSINNEPGGDLGEANWEDLEASCLSELIASLAADLDGTLLDAEIATALLTGIVAETSRFSNGKTHPRTMTVSSMLLQAGADQMLVNTQLQDLIGTVVNLTAGSEIKPTKDLSHEPLRHDDVADELVIDESGMFKPPASAGASTSGATGSDGDAPKNEQVTEPGASAKQQSSAAAAPTAVQPDAEPDLELPSLAAPSPEPEAPRPAPTPEPAPLDTEDADSARKAVESALGVPDAGGQPAFSEAAQAADLPAIDVAGLDLANPPGQVVAPAQNYGGLADFGLPGSGLPPAPAPQTADVAASTLIQPITPNQPSYANPATMTQYDMPPAPHENEPAPLGMSPADQAFTMPMPPTSSMPGQQGGAQAAPSSPQQPGLGQTPPPLPPPVMPTGFSQ